MKQLFGFFLTLSTSDNEILQPIIAHLQQLYCNQPPFQPHISIYHSVNSTSLAGTIAAVSNAIKDMKQFNVVADGIESENVWSRILYIKLKPNPNLSIIRHNLSAELGDEANSSFSPHISLMYKDKLSTHERNKIVTNLVIPSTYTVQGVSIVSPGTKDNTWRNYSKWRILHSVVF